MPASVIKTHAQTVCVTDIKLAASLMALGIHPLPGEEVSITTGDANRVVFNFLPHGATDDGLALTANAIVRAWKQEREATCREEEWSYQNPDHPLSYLMCAWDNYLCIRDYVRKATAKVYMKRGRSVALLDPKRASQKQQEHILGKIGA